MFFVGLFLGILIVYGAIFLQFPLFIIPIKYIQIYYYKSSTKILEKLNKAQYEREIRKVEMKTMQDYIKSKNRK